MLPLIELLTEKDDSCYELTEDSSLAGNSKVPFCPANIFKVVCQS